MSVEEIFKEARYDKSQMKLWLKTQCQDRYGGNRWFSMEYISNIETAQNVVDAMNINLIVQPYQGE